jgi:PKD repeat protein
MQPLIIYRKRRWFTAIPFIYPKLRWLTVSALLLAVNFVFVGLATAAGPQCTSPYVQVQDGATTLFPDQTMQFTIERVNIGEAFVNCSTKRLTAILKVPTMDPGNTGTPHAPPNGSWSVYFNIPGSANSLGTPQQIFLQYDTTINPAGGFNYGWFDVAGGGFNCSQCTPGIGACAVTGTIAADGTITMNLNLSSTVTFGTCDPAGMAPSMSISPAQWTPGTQLTNIQGQTSILVGAAGTGEGFTDAQTAGDGEYTVQGNLACSNPPVAALAAVPTSGSAPLTVNFNASASNVPAGGCGTINSYTFTFGDTTQVTQASPTVSHTYTTAGTYSARVRVTTTSGVTSSNIAEQIITVNSAGPPQVVSIVSRLTHGLAGDFDIVLPQPPATRAVECRSAGGSYKLVFTFLNNLTSVTSASVTAGAGSIGTALLGPNLNQYTVNLTGVTSGQSTTVKLTNAQDSTGATGDVTAILGVLIGDVSNNAVVSNTDVSSIKAQVGASVTTSNFRNDVTINGVISNTDVSTTKAVVGTTLP